jgi:hypothetical protein
MHSASAKDQALFPLMDQLYREIYASEREIGMAASADDVRVPIDKHHDAVRAWMSGEDRARLTVDWLSYDLSSLRQRARWLRRGPSVIWEERDPHAEARLKDAQTFKRFLIRQGERALVVPEATMAHDLHVFYSRYAAHTALLMAELKQRFAERFRAPTVAAQPGRRSLAKHGPAAATGRWVALGPEEFLDGMRYIVRHYPLLEKPLQASLEHVAGAGDANVPAVDDRHTGRRPHQALANMWVQIMHPYNLHASFQKPLPESGELSLRFMVAEHMSEAEWQVNAFQCEQLAGLYDRYAMFFAAAMSDTVNEHYKEEKDELDQLVRDSARLIRRIEAMEAGGPAMPIHMLERLLHDVDNPELKRRIAAILDSMRVDTSSGSVGDMAAKPVVQGVMEQAEREVEELEQKHFSFLTNQLASYEQGKEFIKGLAQKGINLAGKFAEAAVAVAAGRGKGGRGM